MKPVRVAVVDDDEVTRRGVRSILAEQPGITPVLTASHTQAAGWTREWSGVDVALVDAVDEERADDQFPGVCVVERIRALTGPAGPVVIVVTPYFFDDALRRRMREARADFFYHRDELGAGQRLVDAILRPDRDRRVVPGPVDAETQFRQGVTALTRVNRGVGYALRAKLPQLLATRPAPRSRMWLRLRQEFNEQARLSPVTADGRLPDRTQELPSLPQIARFLDWATRTKPGTAPAQHRLVA